MMLMLNTDRNQNLVQNRYYGSLIVGHCKNEDLHKHFEHFLTKIQCHKSFLKCLHSHFLIENYIFLDTGTFPLHTIHNAFSKGVRVIDFDIK